MENPEAYAQALEKEEAKERLQQELGRLSPDINSDLEGTADERADQGYRKADQVEELASDGAKSKPFGGKKCYLDGTWCIGRSLYTWVTPLVEYARAHGKLDVNLYGELPKEDKVEQHI